MIIVLSVTILIYYFYFREPCKLSIKKYVDMIYESAVCGFLKRMSVCLDLYLQRVVMEN